MEYTFKVEDIPPVSLNQIYKGIHWNERKKYKDSWREAFCGWHDTKFDKPVHISYVFSLKYPMDSSNVAFMVKLIEDALVKDNVLEDDDYKWVLSTQMISMRGKTNTVYVHITDEDSPRYSELIDLFNSDANDTQSNERKT